MSSETIGALLFAEWSVSGAKLLHLLQICKRKYQQTMKNMMKSV